jgi:hypothetical protein
LAAGVDWAQSMQDCTLNVLLWLSWQELSTSGRWWLVVSHFGLAFPFFFYFSPLLFFPRTLLSDFLHFLSLFSAVVIPLLSFPCFRFRYGFGSHSAIYSCLSFIIGLLSSRAGRTRARRGKPRWRWRFSSAWLLWLGLGLRGEKTRWSWCG